MTRKSRGTYVLVFGLFVVIGGIALAFLPGPGWLLIPVGAAIAGVGAALLLLERTAAKAAAMTPPDEPPDGGR
jgi:glucose dehydrogenase